MKIPWNPDLDLETIIQYLFCMAYQTGCTYYTISSVVIHALKRSELTKGIGRQKIQMVASRKHCEYYHVVNL